MNPFYWHDIDDAPSWQRWIYRASTTIGLACVASLIILLLIGLTQ